MTPLAQAVLNDYAEPIRHRMFKDQSNLLPRLMSAHCFEVTPIFGLAGDLAESLHKRGHTARGTLAFLPAPLTWIEWRRGTEGAREGVLLEELSNNDGVAEFASATWAFQGSGMFLSAKKPGLLMLNGDGRIDQPYTVVRGLIDEDESKQRGWIAFMYMLLACINSPHVVGRRQHMPHAGLQRRLAAAQKTVGKWPLQAWHELVLEVMREPSVGGRESETHLTGQKALHFVLKFVRVRLGRLEWVKSHWRGNGALGIKQTRYSVVPGKRRAA